MRLLPAIDIQGRRCVRLRKGDFADETVFGEDPVAMAVWWVEQGARYLHVVDLDGAREGAPRNFDLIRAIAEAVPASIEAGGGFRSMDALELVRQGRVAKVVLGTSAVEDKDFLRRALELLGPGRVVVAIDAEDGLVKTRGWQEQSGVRALDLVRELETMGVWEILYTDISRDGMMESMNLAGLRELAENSSVDIIASGGVTTLDDLRALKQLEELQVTGVIVGRALYEKRFTVAEARAVLDSPVQCCCGIPRDAQLGRGQGDAPACGSPAEVPSEEPAATDAPAGRSPAERE